MNLAEAKHPFPFNYLYLVYNHSKRINYKRHIFWSCW